jgi:hypothetical protein
MQGWKQHGPTFEARSKATILFHRRFLLVAVHTHIQSTRQKIRRKYGALPHLVRHMATEVDPGVSSCVRRHVCQNWHLCNCTWGAQNFCAGEQDLNFSLHDLPLLAGKAKERQGRAPYQARKMEMSQS